MLRPSRGRVTVVLSVSLIGLTGLACGCMEDDVAEGLPARIWLVGDSTVAPETGWGDALGPLMGDEVAAVHNRARGGRSSKSYYEEADSPWHQGDDAVVKRVSPGDYIFIQFGHNDQKSDEARHTTPGPAPDFDGSYRDYLERYIDEARDLGATPVLITPVSRMTFDAQGHHVRDHGNYPAAMIRTAQLNDVTLIDLETRSHEAFERLGEAATLEYYASHPVEPVEPGEPAESDEPADRTHFPPDKSWRVAVMVHELLPEDM